MSEKKIFIVFFPLADLERYTKSNGFNRNKDGFSRKVFKFLIEKICAFWQAQPYRNFNFKFMAKIYLKLEDEIFWGEKLEVF